MNLNPITMQLVADKYIRFALEEDIHSEDVSTNAVMPEYKAGEVELICKQDGVIAGLPVFERVFTMLDASTKVEWAKNQDGREVKDGDAVKKGQLLATVKGDVRVLLSGERTALNYLQRLSGIATYTHQVARLLEGSSTTLLDTRKTTPCMRIFEKYAVCVGGGQNHRYNLSDGVLLKDNHIDAAGGVKEAILAAKAYAPFVRKIEVETENLDMVKEAVDTGTDVGGNPADRRQSKNRVLRKYHKREYQNDHSTRSGLCFQRCPDTFSTDLRYQPETLESNRFPSVTLVKIDRFS